MYKPCDSRHYTLDVCGVVDHFLLKQLFREHATTTRKKVLSNHIGQFPSGAENVLAAHGAKIARNSNRLARTLMKDTKTDKKYRSMCMNGDQWERYREHSVAFKRNACDMNQYIIGVSYNTIGWMVFDAWPSQTHTIPCNSIWKVEAETESFAFQEESAVFVRRSRRAAHQWNELHLLFIIMRGYSLSAFYKMKIFVREIHSANSGFVWSSHLRGIRSLQWVASVIEMLTVLARQHRSWKLIMEKAFAGTSGGPWDALKYVGCIYATHFVRRLDRRNVSNRPTCQRSRWPIGISIMCCVYRYSVLAIYNNMHIARMHSKNPHSEQIFLEPI